MRLYERAHFPDEYASSSELYAGIDEFRRVVILNLEIWPFGPDMLGLWSILLLCSLYLGPACQLDTHRLGNTEPHEPAVEEFVPDVSEESSSKTGLSKTELCETSQ